MLLSYIVCRQIMKVERLSQKLRVMSYIGNFFDQYHHLQPVSLALLSSLSILSSVHSIQCFSCLYSVFLSSSNQSVQYFSSLSSISLFVHSV